MNVMVNGAPWEVAEDITVERLLIDAAGSTRGSAVVVDGEVVPRSSWPRQMLRDGQTIELITAVQGG